MDYLNHLIADMLLGIEESSISYMQSSGDWGYPAFYNLGALSMGFQIGGENFEIILVIMTDRGSATTADFCSYSKTKKGFRRCLA